MDPQAILVVISLVLNQNDYEIEETRGSIQLASMEECWRKKDRLDKLPPTPPSVATFYYCEER